MNTFQQAVSGLNWSRSLTAGQRASAGLAVLTAALPELRTLRRGWADEISGAQREINADTGLNADGRLNRLTERTNEIRTVWLPRLEALRDNVESAAEAVEKAVTERWPTPAAGVEAMLGRQAAWARARSLLESSQSGTDLFGAGNASLSVAALIRETTDVETLHALRDELPTWVRTRGVHTDAAAAVAQAVDMRIAEVASNSTIDLTAGRRAQAEVAGIMPMLRQAESELQGGRADGLTAALASRYDRQRVLHPLADVDGAAIRNPNLITASAGDAA